jgi:hypothetical protein
MFDYVRVIVVLILYCKLSLFIQHNNQRAAIVYTYYLYVSPDIVA